MRKVYRWFCLLLMVAGAGAQTPPDSLHRITRQPAADSLRTRRQTGLRSDSLSVIPHKELLRPLRTAIPSFFADSTLRLGSGYGSLADLFSLFPGGYHFDRGSIGLPAFGALFSAPPSGLHLVYDTFLLDDPLTGRADLNLIPVESIARQTLFSDPVMRPYSGLAASQTLEITGRDLALDTLRSQVAYRTGGKGYDDIDVRAGLRYSPRLRINAGGLLKNYAGTTSLLEKYRAQKINLTVSRTIGRRWQAVYRLLYNIYDLNLPLHQERVPAAPALQQPHQKESRFDHGLEIEYNGAWRTLIQLTDQQRERHSHRRALWEERTDALRIDLRSSWQWRWRRLEGMTGGQFRRSGLQSTAWGDHNENLFAGWTALSARPLQRLVAFAQVRVEKPAEAPVQLLPQLQLRQEIAPSWQGLAWYERSRSSVALAARFEQSPYAQGDPELNAESGDHLGLGLYHVAKGFLIFAAISASRIEDEVLLAWDPQQQLAIYHNRPVQKRLSLDATVERRLSSWFSVNGKIKQLFVDGDTPLNQPETAAMGWLQVQHTFFFGDLDTRLRLGCSFWGERRGPLPYDVDYSAESALLEAVLVPWLQATAVIKDATLFFSLQNPLGIDYEVVRLYPQPQRLIRWGFVWNFYN